MAQDEQTDAKGPAGQADAFAQQAEEKAPGLFREFWDFLCDNKKWWLLPILIVLGLFTALAILSTTPAAPFIYTLF
jgi:hypothetical protein